jgi:hypothetical protein
LAGCAAPELDREFVAFSIVTAAALGSVEAMITAETKAEQQAAREAAIAARAPVISSGGAACEDYLTEVPSARAADCEIRPMSRPYAGADPATALAELIAAMRAYSNAIGALVETDEPSRIAAAGKALMENAEALKTKVAVMTGNADFSAAAEPLSSIAVTFAEGYKLAQIGRIARATDPTFQRGVETLAAAIVERRPDFVKARDERIDACTKVDTLRLAQADPEVYRNAIERCERGQAKVAAIDIESKRAAVMSLGPAHSALAKASRSRVDVDAFLMLFENLEAAKSALSGENQ